MRLCICDLSCLYSIYSLRIPQIVVIFTFRMTGLVCVRSGSHWNGKMLEKSEKGTISIFEIETSSFPLGYGIGNLSTGEI